MECGKKGFTLQNFLKKNLGGFTLIELLVVIAIIGILSGIVLVSLGGARAQARDARRQSDIRQVVSAQEMYYGDNDKYVTAVAGTGTPVISTYLGALDDPLTTKHYNWLDNTSCDQKFCTYATMESKGTCATGENRYFAASEKGTKEICAASFAGTGCACW